MQNKETPFTFPRSFAPVPKAIDAYGATGKIQRSYVAVYRTRLIQGSNANFAIPPVRIEITEGPVELATSSTRMEVMLEDKASPPNSLQVGTMLKLEQLYSQKYILLTTRTKEAVVSKAEAECTENIDTVVTLLSSTYGSDLFADLIYKGWVFDPKNFGLTTWIKVSPAVDLSDARVNGEVALAQLATDPDVNSRFRLASRFYSSAAAMPPSPEKLLLLWTVLEIYPLKNETSIWPICQELEIITGKSRQKINEVLGIGRLHGIRSALVHHGKLTVPLEDFGGFLQKIDDIVCVILRAMTGQQYDGRLDRYFC